MGKNNKKRRIRSSSSRPTATIPKNPMFSKQQAFLQSLSAEERHEFFSPNLSTERRAELWMQQADLGEALIDQYSWATPNETAIQILKEFSPIIEIGCGANAYWCRMMHQAGIDVVGYDSNIHSGGKIINNGGSSQPPPPPKEGDNSQTPIRVHRGGPKVLAHGEHSHRTLFLCYPDEEDEEEDEDEDANMNTATTTSSSMGAQCLEYYQGTYIVHVGELALLADSTLSMDQAPWGRSSGPEFQERLAAEYHCLLKVQLPNWLHVRDSISVWKRSETSTIVFAADEEDEDEDEDEEVEYRHIPMSERLLPTNLAAPCLAHLLPSTNETSLSPSRPHTSTTTAGSSQGEMTTTTTSTPQEEEEEEKKSPELQKELHRKRKKSESHDNKQGARDDDKDKAKKAKGDNEATDQQREQQQVENNSPNHHQKKKSKSKSRDNKKGKKDSKSQERGNDGNGYRGRT